MTYRNDHDAALMRVAALESELAQLKKQQPSTPPPKRSRWPTVLLSLVAAAAFAVAVAGMRASHNTEAEAAPDVAVAKSDSLRSCAQAIQRVDLDATTTDPRGQHAPVSPLAATGAACRSELARLATDSSELDRWRVAEDRLANAISLITVYYGSDPYKLDGYTSAPQLWREYDRARGERDTALAALTL